MFAGLVRATETVASNDKHVFSQYMTGVLGDVKANETYRVFGSKYFMGEKFCRFSGPSPFPADGDVSPTKYEAPVILYQRAKFFEPNFVSTTSW